MVQKNGAQNYSGGKLRRGGESDARIQHRDHREHPDRVPERLGAGGAGAEHREHGEEKKIRIHSCRVGRGSAAAAWRGSMTPAHPCSPPRRLWLRLEVKAPLLEVKNSGGKG